MNTRYNRILIILSFNLIFLIVTTGELKAQFCKTCTVTVGETCTTDTDEQGWRKCSCGPLGCDCEKTCGIGMHTKIYIDENFNWEQLDVANEGLRIKLIEGSNLNLIYSYFNKVGFLGAEQVEEVFIGKKMAIYKIKEDSFFVYPITKKREVKIYSQCDGEILATASSMLTKDKL